MLRAFIALDIHPGILSAIDVTTIQLRKEIGSFVRWVPAENMHLTLKFLGGVSPTQVESLIDMLRIESDRCTPFEMHIGRFGAFPSLKRPRVLFIGIQAPAALDALVHGIQVGCERLGFTSEARGFHPHLTLGRVRQNLNAIEGQTFRRLLETVKIDLLGTARVDSVHLYKSELKRDGAVYTRLFSAPLHTIIASPLRGSQ